MRCHLCDADAVVLFKVATGEFSKCALHASVSRRLCQTWGLRFEEAQLTSA